MIHAKIPQLSALVVCLYYNRLLISHLGNINSGLSSKFLSDRIEIK